MTDLPPGYDAWRLSAPEFANIGETEGEPCNRFPEPDGDEPRGYKPTRCDGVMVMDDETLVCSVCGEAA